ARGLRGDATAGEARVNRGSGAETPAPRPRRNYTRDAGRPSPAWYTRSHPAVTVRRRRGVLAGRARRVATAARRRRGAGVAATPAGPARARGLRGDATAGEARVNRGSGAETPAPRPRRNYTRDAGRPSPAWYTRSHPAVTVRRRRGVVAGRARRVATAARRGRGAGVAATPAGPARARGLRGDATAGEARVNRGSGAETPAPRPRRNYTRDDGRPRPER